MRSLVAPIAIVVSLQFALNGAALGQDRSPAVANTEQPQDPRSSFWDRGLSGMTQPPEWLPEGPVRWWLINALLFLLWIVASTLLSQVLCALFASLLNKLRPRFSLATVPTIAASFIGSMVSYVIMWGLPVTWEYAWMIGISFVLPLAITKLQESRYPLSGRGVEDLFRTVMADDGSGMLYYREPGCQQLVDPGTFGTIRQRFDRDPALALVECGSRGYVFVRREYIREAFRQHSNQIVDYPTLLSVLRTMGYRTLRWVVPE